MAVTQSSLRPGKTAAAGNRNSRRHEIIAIALFAVAALFALSLASYHPNDASWNAAGGAEVRRNLVGAIGANVSSALFQAVGLAAYLLPAL
ncbi:MAG TPA: DNA translocase FtsK 4TM domain-containing protein, partial [Pyrinomonadaceae bacterium]|nr:DNA translocase FtsK 4TM domain-containing protein [Pyrinomonadaceae bacterium]